MNSKIVSESIKAGCKNLAIEQGEKYGKTFGIMPYENGALGAWIDILCEKMTADQLQQIARIVQKIREEQKSA